MGTDIHVHVETRGAHGWQRAEVRVPNKYYDHTDPDDSPFEFQSWYTGRNYTLFAALAGVRNGVGFAGVDLGDPLTPIAEPRGLPDDASPDTLCNGTDWGHTHTWFTLDELLRYPWHDVRITQRGVVDAEEYQRFKRIESFLGEYPWAYPENYSGSVSGALVRNVSNDEMDRLIKANDTKSVYTKIEWRATLGHRVGSEWFAFLVRCAGLGDPRDTRLVIWFDS